MSFRPLVFGSTALCLGIICTVWLARPLLPSYYSWPQPAFSSFSALMELRNGTLDDLDEITEVAYDAFPGDPQWDYRLRWRSQFPDVTRKCTRQEYQTALRADDDRHFLTKVITAPSDEDENKKKVIAIAVWERDYLEESKAIGGPAPGPGCSPPERKDMDTKRDKAFVDAIRAGKKRYFDEAFGKEQLHLMVLATHPHYQKRGAGTMHCKWGISLAKEKDLHITVFASPMGEELYKELGFKAVGAVVIQVEGEEEKIDMPAMVYDPSD